MPYKGATLFSPPYKGATLFSQGALAATAALACVNSVSPTQPLSGAVFLIRVGDLRPGEALGSREFKVLTRDPDVIREASTLVGAGNLRIVIGEVRRGDGGFNDPWSWHLDPEGVSFTDLTTEFCDGTPSYVEAHLDAWIDQVGRYCPWSTEVLARLR